MSTWKKLLIAGLAISAPVIGVLLLASVMAPVQEGNSAAFWKSACGIDLEGDDGEYMTGFYPPRDNYYIYYESGFHGEFLFRVPRSEAIADFQKVVQRIKALPEGTNDHPKVQWAAAVVERDSSAADGPDQFLLRIRDERLIVCVKRTNLCMSTLFQRRKRSLKGGPEYNAIGSI